MTADITSKFEAHSLDNTTFGHAEHVQVAYDLLRKYDYIEAAAIYAKGIRTLAAKAGAPDKFNLTITYAFMSLIAERLANSQTESFKVFTQENPDLMAKTVLNTWYSKERLNSALAREVFLLPFAA